MIQRIQTLYLFLAFVATVLIFIFPLAEFSAPGFACILKVTGLTYLADSAHPISVNTILLLLLLICTSLLSLISVFLFKNRILQLRFVKIDMIASVIFVILIFIYSEKLIGSNVPDIKPVFYQAGSYLSLVVVVLLILASRRIIHDDKKIKAADRIR